MLTRSKAQQAPWTLHSQTLTGDSEIKVTECGADARLRWEVITPRGKARKTRVPTSAFLVVDGDTTTRHPKLREALAALNALGKEVSHG